MSIKDLPEQINMLDGSNHKFVIARLPMTVFTVQQVTVPTMSLPAITTGNPFIKLNFASTELQFSELRITFKVDEDMRNYTEVFNWMRGLGFPEDFAQYRELKANVSQVGGVRSDASLIVNTSSKISNKSFNFRDVFPVSLGNLSFVTNSPSSYYLTAEVVFSIRDFTIETVVP